MVIEDRNEGKEDRVGSDIEDSSKSKRIKKLVSFTKEDSKTKRVKRLDVSLRIAS